jgi:hypothetical protein
MPQKPVPRAQARTATTATARLGTLMLSIACGLAACGGGGGGGGPGGSAAGATPAAQAAAIVTQPAPQTVASGAAATFTVGASGASLTYQWRRDGKDIAGATAASYTLNGVQPEDDGAVFTVEVKNGAGSVVSAGAALRIAVPQGLSLLAGRLGGPGSLDGHDGRLWNAYAVGVGPAGPMYVFDSTSFLGQPGALRTLDPATGALATVRQLPRGLAIGDIEFDAAGNRYDMLDQAIFKTTPDGVRTLLAGAEPEAGKLFTPTVPADGSGADARFGGLADMAVDAGGNLYVIDLGSRQVRKVDPAGKVVTLAGNGNPGAADGKGSGASFQRPEHLTVDRAGNVFVVDRGLNAAFPTKLRKVAPDGTVTTLALKPGDANAAGLGMQDYAGAIASDGAGNLYVTDNEHGCRIRRVAADGTLTDLAGGAVNGYADGKGAGARFCGTGTAFPTITTDKAGNLIVLDAANYAVRRVTPDGTVTTVGGRAPGMGSADGKGAAAAFAMTGLLDAGEISNTDYRTPGFTLVADAQGNAYVGELDDIRKVTPSGTVATLPAAKNAGYGARYYPGGLGWGGSALVIQNNMVYRVDADGNLQFVAGKAGAGRGAVDGTGADATFAEPFDPVVDGLGNIYVHDTRVGPDGGPQRIERKISPEGVVTTLPVLGFGERIMAWYADQEGKVWTAHDDGSVRMIGTDGKRSIVRAAPLDASWSRSTAVTRDAAGNVYLGELQFSTGDKASPPWFAVRKIAPDGQETVVAGTAGSTGVRLGSPGSLGRVQAMAPGPDGTLYLMSELALLKLKP